MSKIRSLSIRQDRARWRFPCQRIDSFVHKWSGATVGYREEDIHLPATVDFWGDLDRLEGRRIVGIGGTRSPSAEAFKAAWSIAFELAREGAVICSGAVPGIDLAAHLGAVDASTESAFGGTIGVLANPAIHGVHGHEWGSATLYSAIAENGGFISEYSSICAIDGSEFRERLLNRDRIISGISDIFIAFECSIDSATIDTAKRAYLQGKDVIGIDVRSGSSRTAHCLVEKMRIGRVFSYRQGCAKDMARELLRKSQGSIIGRKHIYC